MALGKYNGFVAGDILPAENANSVDPDNIESPVVGEAFRIIRATIAGLLPDELLAGVDGSGLINLLASTLLSASDNLKLSADTERTHSDATPTKKKEVVIKQYGTIRVKYDLKGESGADHAKGQVYVNGSAVGADNITTTANYETFTDASITVKPGDLVQLYINTSSNVWSMYTRNFRIYWDLVSATPGAVITD